jgi:chemotaxis protein methyltransferase CheR
MSDAGTGSGRGAKHGVFRDREFPYSHADFQRIAAIMREGAGIDLPDVKAPLVYSRLVKRLRSLGVESFKRYCALVAAADGMFERDYMIAAITTNVTCFFREPHHFEHLTTKVLPDLVDGIRRGGKLRIWSAGCSTGEEPYSIALSILSVFPDAAKYDVKVLATDINRNVLTTAKQGLYSESATAPLSRQMRAQHFRPARLSDNQRAWQVGDEVKALVAFRTLNLISAWPMRQLYHVIFCRNVAIYFDDVVRKRLWERFEAMMTPGGYLYIGHSERLPDRNKRLELDGNTIYRAANKVPA